MRAGLLLATSVLIVLADVGANAATQNVLFNATIAPTCTLTIVSNGLLAASPDLQTLSSKLSGGASGSVSLTTTGGVDLSVDPVTVVTAPPADVSATSWTPTYSAAGSHTVAETGGSTTLNDPGVSTVTVHLVGTKGGSDRFTSGNYQATVTVRCE
ncbi:MAG: hypothetical protein JJ864_03330 [Rhizobiaceae bacterium]|nr:hypothetical protein [Rhizobiaceae bacterium]